MREMNYVVLHGSYEEELEAYSDVQVGRMFRGLLHLLNTGEEYRPIGSEKYIWPSLRGQFQRNLDNYRQKCEVYKANSKKGVAARKAKKAQETADGSPNITNGFPNTTNWLPIGYKENENEKENENGNENVKENVKENEKGNEKEREKETISISPAVGEIEIVSFSPPNAEEVDLFCKQEGLSCVDAELFVDYYTSVGWTVGGRPMHSWQAAARMWNNKPVNGKEKNHDTGNKERGIQDYHTAARYGIVV